MLSYSFCDDSDFICGKKENKITGILWHEISFGKKNLSLNYSSFHPAVIMRVGAIIIGSGNLSSSSRRAFTLKWQPVSVWHNHQPLTKYQKCPDVSSISGGKPCKPTSSSVPRPLVLMRCTMSHRFRGGSQGEFPSIAQGSRGYDYEWLASAVLLLLCWRRTGTGWPLGFILGRSEVANTYLWDLHYGTICATFWLLADRPVLFCYSPLLRLAKYTLTSCTFNFSH